MNKLGDLFVNVSAKGVTQANAALGVTEKKATMASKAAMMLKTALLGIGAYAVIHAIRSVINEFTDYTVQIDKFTKQTGIATDTIQKLVYAAEQEHASLESLNKGLMNLTVRLGYAGDGLETYLRYFRALGIEYKNADGTLRDTYDVFLDIADAVSKGTLSTEELAAVLQLFGARSGKELIPLLKMGRHWFEEMGNEAERLGIVLEDKTIKQGKEFSDQMTKLNKATMGLKYTIAQDLIPTLIDLASHIENLSQYYDKLKWAYEKIITLGGPLNMMYHLTGRSTIDLAKKLGILKEKAVEARGGLEGFGNLMRDTLGPTIDDFKPKVDNLTESFEDAIEQYRLFLELDEARAAVSWKLAKAYGEEGEARQQLTEFELFMMELRKGKKKQTEEDNELIDFETEALYALHGAFNSLSIGMLKNAESMEEWASVTAASLAVVIIKLLALSGMVKFLETLGVPAGALLSAGSKIGLFQTPTGDMFAYREGLDMGKYFFSGMRESFNSKIGEISGMQKQQPTNIIIHTGDPSTFVEFVSGMPLAYKSKFNRDVINKANELES